jgi:ElaA protein
MVEWQWKNFGDLDAASLYAVLALRSEVFVVEQQCIYQDIDGMDPQAVHLLGWQAGPDGRRLAAYLRVFAPGIKHADVSLGRVISAPFTRGTGLGRALLREGLDYVARTWPDHALRISAQCYLRRFYGEFGFAECSEEYDEDGIQHVDMRLAQVKT